ncbi:reverse transcriptase domain-containing protein [Tanacetum coccineum]
MVTSEGIRANPKKTKAIVDTQSPRTLKEMQSLSGKLAALKRFLSCRAAVANHPSKGGNAIRICGNGNGGHKCRIASRKKEETMSDTLHELDVEQSREELCLVGKIGHVIVAHVQEVTKLAKYSVELGAYNIAYEPRNVMKGQVLADFLSEAPSQRCKIHVRSRLNFASTNNEAKYKALLAGLRMARNMKVQNIDVKVDSKLVASQITEATWQATPA